MTCGHSMESIEAIPISHKRELARQYSGGLVGPVSIASSLYFIRRSLVPTKETFAQVFPEIDAMLAAFKAHEKENFGLRLLKTRNA